MKSRFIGAGIVALFFSLAIMPGLAFADENLFEVQSGPSGTTLAELKDVIAGTTINPGTGSAYDGVKFPSGTYDYPSVGTYIEIGRAFIFETATGAVVSFNDGFKYTMTAEADIVFRGSGTINITNAVDRGMYAVTGRNPKIVMQGGSVFIKNTKGYGLYLENGGAFSMTGGYFEVSNCANASTESGISFINSRVEILGGELATFENGGTSSSGFGEIYYESANAFVIGNGAKVTMSSTRAPQNVLVVTGGGSLQVKDSATVTINADRSGKRAINGAGSNAVSVSNGAALTINSSAGAESGVRRCAITVEDAVLNVSGFNYGIDASSLYAKANSAITLDNIVKDVGVAPATGGSSTLIIDGGSVSATPAQSIVNGVPVTLGTSKIDPIPVNAKGEQLARFDITGLANTDLAIAADPADPTNHPAYTYSLSGNQSGTAYIWAPVDVVTFWPSAAAVQTGTPIQTNSAIRGVPLSVVGASAPPAPAPPAGQVLIGWYDTVSGKTYYDLNADGIDTNASLVPLYGQKPNPSPTPINPAGGTGGTLANTGDDLASSIVALGIAALFSAAFAGFRLRKRTLR